MKANVYYCRYYTCTGAHTKQVLAHSELDALDAIWNFNSEAEDVTATLQEGEAAVEFTQWELSCAMINDRNYYYMEDVEGYYNTLTARQLIAFEAAGIEFEELGSMQELRSKVLAYLNQKAA